MPDPGHRRFPRPPLPCRPRYGRQASLPLTPPGADRLRVPLWSRRLRAPVMCARRKGCGAPCLYPDHVFDGGR